MVRDQEYTADDLPSYGVHEQPALVSRTRRQLRTTLIGVVLAGIGLGCALAALLRYPDIDGVHTGRGWILGLVWCTVAMVILAGWQHLSWRRASEVWHGKRTDDLAAVVAVSWILHLVSYAVVLIALVVTVIGLVELGRYATSAIFAVLALIAMIGGQAFAAVQYVRAEGPPGAMPAKFRVTH